ncbi:LysE family translocator [Thalassotalea mangrovi]|uniref:LysE family translocator n=1 Tax=Thalassotalea mangrovi TaxID=2572245 RepID=A0A4U1B5S8_9GAMM|nr:LysE family translocator [Thalassotalea mangrovi]TKB45842.1 LysE family translocator [Thalassotalea mangrovi]
MIAYWQEFLTIALVHFLAVASPGPDFAIVLKQSLTRGRQYAMITSLGVGAGIGLHVGYSLLGIGIIIASNPEYIRWLSLIAAAYLAYLGWGGLTAKANSAALVKATPVNEAATQSKWRAFVLGFVVNGLNVKATLFFVALFSVVVSVTTPLWVKAGYGLYMMLATAAWFCLVSWLFTIRRYQQKLQDKRHVIDRLMGIVLLLLALRIVWQL